MHIKNVLKFFIQYPEKFRLQFNLKKRKRNILLLNHKENRAMYQFLQEHGVDVKFLTKNSIILVLCDYKYDFNDYIESYEDFVNRY